MQRSALLQPSQMLSQYPNNLFPAETASLRRLSLRLEKKLASDSALFSGAVKPVPSS
jgi:hypothetical protein